MPGTDFTTDKAVLIFLVFYKAKKSHSATSIVMSALKERVRSIYDLEMQLLSDIG